MPKFYFHTADGHRDIDHEGVELADAGAARVEAIRYAGAILADDPDVLWDGREFRVSVTDDRKRLRVTIVMLAVDAPDFADLE